MFSKSHKVLNLISDIRNSHPKMEYIYSQGGCLHFYRVLKRVFPEATPWTNENHVITKIDNKYYDISGIVRDTNGYRPLGDVTRGSYYRDWLEQYAKL